MTTPARGEMLVFIAHPESRVNGLGGITYPATPGWDESKGEDPAAPFLVRDWTKAGAV